MPLVRISMREGKSAGYRKAIAEGVHQALVDTIAIPVQDRFQVITEHSPDGLIYNPDYLGIHRSDDVIYIQITITLGRTIEQRRALYARIVELLSADPGVRPEDVFVNLVEVARENWSFGNGQAQYAQEQS
jgi:4-oxalocrotonate tautomerase